MIQTIGDRIEMIIQIKTKGNKLRFSQRCNLNQTTIGKIITKGTNPSANILEKIVKAYPDINCRWLLTGAGGMLTIESSDLENLRKRIEHLEKSLDH